ncbi:hypothetical protein JZ751_003658, partial [Albula glossodonta]
MSYQHNGGKETSICRPKTQIRAVCKPCWLVPEAGIQLHKKTGPQNPQRILQKLGSDVHAEGIRDLGKTADLKGI